MQCINDDKQPVSNLVARINALADRVHEKMHVEKAIGGDRIFLEFVIMVLGRMAGNLTGQSALQATRLTYALHREAGLENTELGRRLYEIDSEYHRAMETLYSAEQLRAAQVFENLPRY